MSERVALVTGSARGIGEAISRRLAVEGLDVAMADIDLETVEKSGEKIAADTARQILTLGSDVTDMAAITEMVDTVVERFGRLDVLVNNAGFIQIKPWNELDMSDWDKVFDINLKSMYFVTQAAAPHLTKGGGGRVINLSSGQVHGPAPNSAHYGSAKYAVVHVTKTFAHVLAPDKITVNAIAPGVVASTRMWDDIGEGYRQYFGREKDERVAELVSYLPLKEAQTPEDIAAAVWYLVSEAGGQVTGTLMNVDGGASM